MAHALPSCDLSQFIYLYLKKNVLKYFNYSPPLFDGKKLTICFSGLLKEDRGIIRFAETAENISENFKDLNLRIKLIGKFDKKETEEKIKSYFISLNNCELELIDWQPYCEISNSLKDVDICFDLREKNFIYNNSLPIKLFEYMACGKPVIYSDIPAIKDLFKTNDFGYFVNPDKPEEIIEAVSNYINDKNILTRHSKKGRELVEKYYNWEVIEKDLIGFVKEI